MSTNYNFSPAPANFYNSNIALMYINSNITYIRRNYDKEIPNFLSLSFIESQKVCLNENRSCVISEVTTKPRRHIIIESEH